MAHIEPKGLGRLQAARAVVARQIADDSHEAHVCLFACARILPETCVGPHFDPQTAVAQRAHTPTFYYNPFYRIVHLPTAVLIGGGRLTHQLLAHQGGVLEGDRIANPPHKRAVDHAHETCEPMWWLSPQTMNMP